MEENTNKAIEDFSTVLEKHLREIQQMLILVPNSMHVALSNFSMTKENLIYAQCFDDQHNDIKWTVSLNIFHNQFGGPVSASCNPGWLVGGWVTSLLMPEFDFWMSCDAINCLKHAKRIKFSDSCVVSGEIYCGDLEKHFMPESTTILVLERTKRIVHDLHWSLYSRIVVEFEKTGKDNSWPFSYALGLMSAHEELLSKNSFSKERLVKSHKELSEIAKNLHATQSFAKSKTIKDLRERLEKAVEDLSKI